MKKFEFMVEFTSDDNTYNDTKVFTIEAEDYNKANTELELTAEDYMCTFGFDDWECDNCTEVKV